MAKLKKKVRFIKKSSLRRTGEPPDDARERLLLAGRALFLKEGARGLAVRRVARDAGVNLGSFVYHFKTKDAFVEEVIHSHYNDFLAIFNRAHQDSQSADPDQTLRHLLEGMVKMASEHGPLILRLMTDAIQGEKAVIQAAIKKPPTHVALMIELIEHCQRKGAIRKDIDSKLVYVLLVVSVGLPQIFIGRVQGFIKNPAVKMMLKKVLGEDFARISVDFALKGLKP